MPSRQKAMTKLLLQLYVKHTVTKLLLIGATAKDSYHLNEMLYYIEGATKHLCIILDKKAKRKKR